jgi:murein DD-endopeptidase MepM/ murein hydrolase activator NlpD
MAKHIKTKDSIRDVKSLDRAAVLKDKLKIMTVKAKTEAEQSVQNEKSRREDTPSGYAESKAEQSADAAAYYAERSLSRLARSRHRKSQANTKSGSSAAGADPKGRVRTKESVIRTNRIKTKRYQVKTGGRSPRTVQTGTRKAAGDAAKARILRQEAARQTAKLASARRTAKSARTAAAAMQKMVRAIIAAFRALVTAIAAGGSVVLVIVILIIMIAVILVSALGIFFSNDGGGMTAQDAIRGLTTEFSDKIQEIENANAHDELQIIYTSGTSVIDWRGVLAVYAVKTTEDADHALDVVSFDDEKLGILRGVLFDMNEIAYNTAQEERSRTVETADEDGNVTTTTETFTVTVLKITVTQKSPDDMAVAYGFTASQNESLAEITKPEYDDLWTALIGESGFTSEGGHGVPSADRIPTGIFTWPLPVAGEITSFYGWREDPFTGEIKYHDGTDIGAPNGTPILAAANGTVVTANSTDNWGGGLGYHVKIDHGGGFATVYAHCSAICVHAGDTVTQGQIIGYVGNTGRSTGNHLHWEVYRNGVGVDGIDYFM